MKTGDECYSKLKVASLCRASHSLSSSNDQLCCISYSSFNESGSEAVCSCNVGDCIHVLYCQKQNR